MIDTPSGAAGEPADPAGVSRRGLIARSAAAGAGIAGLSALLQACGSDETDPRAAAAGGAAAKTLTFEYPQSGGVERFLRVIRNGVEEAADALGVNVNVTATKKFDQVEQGRLVRAAAAKKPDGIITGVWDADIMREPVQSAIDDGIPVVIMNSGADYVEPFGALTFVGWDEAQIAVEAGKRMRADGATNVLAVNHQVGALPLDVRLDGFKEGFGGGEIRTIGVEGTDPVDARNRVKSALQGGDYDGLLTLGQPSGDPALLALRDLDAAGEVVFGTFDQSPTLLQGIQDGFITWAVDQQQYLHGFYPVVALTLYNRYQLRPPSESMQTGGFITKETVGQVVDLVNRNIR
jgi:simple sugar transport system substrate-binding protein